MAEYGLRFLGGYRAVFELRAKLRDRAWVERRLMKGIGNILVGEAQKAFREQRLGDIVWKHRYPNQGDPYVNIAGVVSDFLMGKSKPPDRRFDRRPANMDTGMLLRSLTPGKAVTASGFTVEVGSVLPYAGAAQSGGRSELPVTPDVKERLRKWMKAERKKLTKTGKSGGKTMAQAMKYGAMNKLGFLLAEKTVRLKVNRVPRPFLGVTDEAEQKILDLIAETLSQDGTGGGVTVGKG